VAEGGKKFPSSLFDASRFLNGSAQKSAIKTSRVQKLDLLLKNFR
jgi:hypothetical protein